MIEMDVGRTGETGIRERAWRAFCAFTTSHSRHSCAHGCHVEITTRHVLPFVVSTVDTTIVLIRTVARRHFDLLLPISILRTLNPNAEDGSQRRSSRTLGRRRTNSDRCRHRRLLLLLLIGYVTMAVMRMLMLVPGVSSPIVKVIIGNARIRAQT